jgi:hypothetical protein
MAFSVSPILPRQPPEPTEDKKKKIYLYFLIKQSPPICQPLGKFLRYKLSLNAWQKFRRYCMYSYRDSGKKNFYVSKVEEVLLALAC